MRQPNLLPILDGNGQSLQRYRCGAGSGPGCGGCRHPLPSDPLVAGAFGVVMILLKLVVTH
jgi:hypothetical protein